MKSLRVLTAFLFVIGVLSISARPSKAVMKMRGDPPVDRLVENLTAYIKEHPTDPDGYYRLGRIHAVAFVARCQNLTEVKTGDRYEYEPEKKADKPETPMTEEAATAHCKAAIENLAKAIEMAPKKALYRLGMGYLLQTGAPLAQMAPYGVELKKLTDEETATCEKQFQKLGQADKEGRARALKSLQQLGSTVLTVILAHIKDPNEQIRTQAQELLALLWREQAIANYLKAYQLGKDEEPDKFETSGNKFETVYLEAGDAYAKMVKARGPTEAEKPVLEAIDTELARNYRHYDISPIVFPLDQSKPMHDLLDRNTTVSFALDGTNASQRWQWVKADTAILVWDPRGEGKITSGRQLFGNVTWWIFWDNGYQALDALDDNRDGQLTGAELTGLGVWRDANQNGVSEPGEVVPVVNVGIDAISVRAPEVEDGCPANRQGLHMTSGETLPTYDWYAPGVAAAKGR